MAGESARASAKRLREKAERQARVAAMFERGAEGEEATAAALAALTPDEWTVFHDLRWPGRKFANVDHVVVGPPGVFVIDSKNWTGSISVSDNVLRQNGRAREAAVHGSAEAALAVSGLSRTVSPLHVHPVICFVRDEPIVGWARDVMLCSTGNLLEMLTSRNRVLPDDVRQVVTLELDAALRPAMERPVRVGPSPTGGPRRTDSSYRPYRPIRARRRRLGCLPTLGIVVLTLVGLLLAIGLVANAVRSWTSDDAVGANADGSCPGDHAIKAWTTKKGQRLYREPGWKAYGHTRARACFPDVVHVSIAGYRAAPH
jgi:hypothetical protein